MLSCRRKHPARFWTSLEETEWIFGLLHFTSGPSLQVQRPAEMDQIHQIPAANSILDQQQFRMCSPEQRPSARLRRYRAVSWYKRLTLDAGRRNMRNVSSSDCWSLPCIMVCLVLRDDDVERTSWYVLVPPLHDEDVAALFLHRVRYVVHPVAHVFDVDFLTGRLWPVDTDHQHVGACRTDTRSETSRKHQETKLLHIVSPALLQSTVNVFFWLMKAFDRPAPWDRTLLASDENLGKEAKAPPIADVLVTVSTRTDDVSWRLWPPDRRGPAGGWENVTMNWVWWLEKLLETC